MSKNRLLCGLALGAAVVMVTGCGQNKNKTDKGFFTSGSREADQRADQQMAKQQQLTGGTDNGGVTHGTNSAVVASDKKSLFQNLGGADGINAIVDDFMTRALADPRVNWDRIGVKRGGFNFHRGDSMTWNSDPNHMKALKLHMAQFMALATGGPTQYTGKEMSAAHQNMHITNAEFDATMGDMKATLDRLKIANTEQKQLLSIIESTRPQVAEER